MGQELVVGRMVYYVSPDSGEALAATVTKVWSVTNLDAHASAGQDQRGTVNLNVDLPGDGVDGEHDDPPVERRTSVVWGFGRGQWHWPREVA